MLLAIKYGAVVDGVEKDVVLGHHADGTVLPKDAYPAADIILSWQGDLSDLGRVGTATPGVSAELDGRLHEAPPFDGIAYAAAKRFAVETGGFTFKGHRIASDREAAAPKIQRLYLRALSDPSYTVPYFGVGSGETIALSNADVVALGEALDDHEQAVRGAEAEAVAGWKAGRLKRPAAIDALFARFGQ